MSHRRAAVNGDGGPHFYVPVNLPTDLLTADERPYGHYLLNLIHWRWCCWRADDRGYVHLCDDLLRRFIPDRRLKVIKRKLCRGGVVECDFVAKIGRKAYGYRLKEPYRKTHRIACGNDRLAEKIMDSIGRQRDQLTPTCQWLRDKLDLLQFDGHRAHRVICAMVPKDGAAVQDVEEYRDLVGDAAGRLARGELWLTRCRYGRVHTPLTSLPAALRRCLTVRGERLVSIDLRNSQPLFLGVACLQAKPTLTLYTPTTSTTTNPTPHPTPPYNDAYFPDTASDLRAYLEVCERGEFYESLAHPDRTRDDVKARLWNPLFGHPGRDRPYEGWVWARLNSRYPTVARFIRDSKARDHKRLAHLLQGAESDFFINTVCRRLMREEPDLPLYTIHDSLLTTADNVRRVRGVIMDEFSKMGLQPSLKVEG